MDRVSGGLRSGPDEGIKMMTKPQFGNGRTEATFRKFAPNPQNPPARLVDRIRRRTDLALMAAVSCLVRVKGSSLALKIYP